MNCTFFTTSAFLKMTSTTIDFRTMPRNVPSLCIPRVFPNIDERRIRGVFDSLDMGEIERVDIIKRTTEKGDKFNRVFIHWKAWNCSDNANQARERLLNGKEIKIIYDDPWFWKISAYRESVSIPRPPVNRNPVRISFDSEEDRHRPRSPGIRPRRDDNRRPNPRQDVRGARSPIRRPRDDRRISPATKPVYKPRTPDWSPPRIREEDTYGVEERERMMMSTHQPVKLDYGNPPPPKKLNFKAKKPIIIEEDAKKEEVKEDGEA